MDERTLFDSQACLGKHRSVICGYFTTLNQAQFDETAALFAPEGELHPPVDDPVIGRSAIAAYLHQEGAGFYLEPLYYRVQPCPDGQTQVCVLGRVRVCPFGSNVSWVFLLNSQGEIAWVKIELCSDD